MFSASALSAHADLYRWVDPETGSVKFSSYPPPWYGNEDLQRRRPRVEHIPERSTPRSLDSAKEPAQAAAREGAPSVDALERQRRAILQQLNEPGRSGEGTQQQLQALATLMEQLDKLNPEGTPARRVEAEALMQKLIRGRQP
jgi:hypothetical protein